MCLMPQVTLEIPEENIPLFLEITEAMGITNKDIFIKDGSPDWHLSVLNERLANYNAGKTGTSSWDEFERELDREDEDE